MGEQLLLLLFMEIQMRTCSTIAALLGGRWIAAE
jgi:hypothetical protein